MSVNKVLFDDRIKPKNVLALNEKVAAIRRYEVEPVYKKIGRLFNCSPDQIKRIIKQKDEILAEWDKRTKKPVPPTLHEIKTVKKSFLGKAVHEWIRRIMYYTDFNLNDTLIQTMALEFSKVLKMPMFYPDKDWIANFRATYNLPDANTKTMSIGYQESHSVQIRDILRYVKGVCGPKNVADVNDEINSEGTVTATATSGIPAVVLQFGEIKTEYDSSNFYGNIDIKVEEENCQPSCSKTLQTSYVSEKRTLITSEIPMQIDSESTSYQPVLIKQQPTIFEPEQIQLEIKEEEPEQIQPEIKEEEPEPETQLEQTAIYSHEGAISCVRLLEDFALLKENFRLIGLIERLEEALNEKSNTN